MRKRTVIICSLVFLVFGFICVAIPLFYVLTRKMENEVAVLNHASEDISQGEVHVFGQTYRFQRLAVNETARIVSSANGEGGYFVNVKFQSGRTLSSEELGYLTAGMMRSDLVEIQDDKITIVESRWTVTVHSIVRRLWYRGRVRVALHVAAYGLLATGLHSRSGAGDISMPDA